MTHNQSGPACDQVLGFLGAGVIKLEEPKDGDVARTVDPKFKSAEGRWEHRAELNAVVEEWTRQRSKHEVMRLLGDAGVPCGACQDTGEVLADPTSTTRRAAPTRPSAARSNCQTRPPK